MLLTFGSRLVEEFIHPLTKKREAIWLVKLTVTVEVSNPTGTLTGRWEKSAFCPGPACGPCGDWQSVEFDGQVLSVFAEELAVVVVDGPEGREVAGLHGGKEVLPPATLQVHQALQALLGMGSHHLQTVRHVRLVENPSGRREEQLGDCRFCTNLNSS